MNFFSFSAMHDITRQNWNHSRKSFTFRRNITCKVKSSIRYVEFLPTRSPILSAYCVNPNCCVSTRALDDDGPGASLNRTTIFKRISRFYQLLLYKHCFKTPESLIFQFLKVFCLPVQNRSNPKLSVFIWKSDLIFRKIYKLFYSKLSDYNKSYDYNR